MSNPIVSQEAMYRLPYHWFPEERLKRFEREEKQRLIFRLLDTHPKHQRALRYLDVGCGDGRWTSDIYHYLGKIEAIGIDFSERAIGFARLITPEIDFQVQRGEALPFPSASFDFVTAIEVIEHVEDAVEERFVQELHRVLQPDGLLILTTPSWNLKLTQHHYRHYSVERLTEVLEGNGFTALVFKGQSLPCYGRKRWLRKRLNLFPFVWKFWKYTYQETEPKRALNLIVRAYPNQFK